MTEGTRPTTGAAADLTPAEAQRYSRHLILPQVGEAGQRRLKAARVAIVGTGGLGSPVAMYLAAAGVGRLGLIDFDVVDVTNLQRQIVHGESTRGVPKVVSAARRLADLNPHITIDTYHTPLTSHNALDLLRPYDIIVDGTDNFPTRYLLNDAAVLLKKPLVYGSIFRFEGQVSVFGAPDGPCYRCLLPVPPPPELVPGCSEAGVFGVLPGTIGTLQATEVIKLILGIGEPLVGRLLLYDALDLTFDTIILPRRANCPACGENPTITGLIDYEEFCGMPAYDSSGFGHGQDDEAAVPEWSVNEIKARLDAGERLNLLDVREPVELTISRLEQMTQHIPMSEMAARWQEIPRDEPVIVFCRSGARSADLIEQLRTLGYDNLINMAGGINAWARTIDPKLPLY
ncbi:MAG: molybdopterin-synthase adenylyltransferase MoeB [Chloroflexi bacterium]|nr:molybdopterin-synthase adenylyltransferase MoeB [Chloroflexota bacterium]